MSSAGIAVWGDEETIVVQGRLTSNIAQWPLEEHFRPITLIAISSTCEPLLAQIRYRYEQSAF